MKKVILILLCISILLPLISCNKKEDIHSTDTQQLTNYGTRAEDDISKKVCFLNYEDVLQRYRELLSDNRSNSNTQSPKEYSVKNDSAIENALQSTVINSDTAQMGYAIYDINNDAQDELVLMDDCYHIYAVFTQTNETPVLLDTFSLNNHYVSLDNNGIFYKTGYGKGEDHYTKIMKIGDGGKLEVLVEYGFDDAVCEYYVIENNVKNIVELSDITTFQERYCAFLLDPAKTTKESGLLFVSAIKN